MHLRVGEIQFLFQVRFGASFVEPAGMLKAARVPQEIIDSRTAQHGPQN